LVEGSVDMIVVNFLCQRRTLVQGDSMTKIADDQGCCLSYGSPRYETRS
jgi:hypothetical protein